MYVDHPLDTDCFDFNQFAESNMDILRKLFIESIALAPGSITNNAAVENRACLMTMAILARKETFREEAEVEFDENDPLVFELFDKVRTLSLLIHMEHMGITEKKGENWGLTAFGEESYSRNQKKRSRRAKTEE